MSIDKTPSIVSQHWNNLLVSEMWLLHIVISKDLVQGGTVSGVACFIITMSLLGHRLRDLVPCIFPLGLHYNYGAQYFAMLQVGEIVSLWTFIEIIDVHLMI